MMDLETALNNNFFQSGDLICFIDGTGIMDDTIEFVESSKVYHVGFVVNRPHGQMLYQAKANHGVNRVPLSHALMNYKFICIKTGYWSDKAEDFADSKIGDNYGWINLFLVDWYLHSQKYLGYICSTYAGATLNEAGANLNLKGLTPARLFDAFKKEGKKRYLFKG